MNKLLIQLFLVVWIVGAQEGTVPSSPVANSGLSLVTEDFSTLSSDTLASQNTLQEELSSFTPPPRDSGVVRLILTSQLDSVSVELNGQKLGFTPLVIDTLPAGAYAFVCTKKGYYGKKIGVTLVADSVVTQVVELRAPGALTILSQPEGATILLNKQRIGVTPYTATPLRPEQYQLLLLKEGFAPLDTTYVITSGAQDTVQFNLHSLTPQVSSSQAMATAEKSPEEVAKRRKTIAIVAASIFTLFIASIFIMEAAGTE